MFKNCIIAAAILLLSDTLVEAQKRKNKKPEDLGYFAGARYQQKSAEEKLNKLWKQCKGDPTVVEPQYEHLPLLFTQDVHLSFDREADEIRSPNEHIRPKTKHSQGVVAKVSWEDLGGHDYTGLFEGGSDLGLIRLSEANYFLPEASGLTPSLAIKFLRDGMASVNHMGNVSFEPTQSFNFFSGPFHSRLPLHADTCAQESIQKKAAEATSMISSLGVANFSRYKTDGTEIEDYKMPFDIWFEPTEEMKGLFPDTLQKDAAGNVIPFWDQLTTIAKDSYLFEVWVRDSPDDLESYPEGSNVQHIANIKLNSKIITSRFGDERLFFKHERMDDDIAKNPSWAAFIDTVDTDDIWGDREVPYWPEDREMAKAWLNGSIGEYGCPFAWLFPWGEIEPKFDQ